MKYDNIVKARFISRPNRFIAQVLLDGREETVHVKNTGRCRELLLPGSDVWLTRSASRSRKTAYDLVAVRKRNGLLINIDSQAPNAAVGEWLRRQNYDEIRPEFVYDQSRMDFFMRRGNRRFLMEVKGCTLERDGIGYFPDAPTARGAKHLRELMKAVSEGYDAALAFVIQMDGITNVLPNEQTDPCFAAAWREAEGAGVKFLMLPCHVEQDGVTILRQRGM